MFNTYATSLMLIAAVATPARTQGIESGVLVGYGALSIGAIVNLASRHKTRTIDVGTKLKVRLRDSLDWSRSATVVGMTNDSIVVVSDAGTGGFARSAIDSIQVKASTGRWAEGWLIGLIVGGAMGAALAHQVDATTPVGDWYTPNQAAVIGGVLGGGATSVVGAGIGLLAPSRWVTIGDPGNVRVSVLPTLARPGFVARVRF